MRGRSNNRRGPNPLTRSFESNGPDVKIRGTAAHIAEKYTQLARDAHASSDPVAAENYLQHAEHYLRLIAAAQQQQYQAQQQAVGGVVDADEGYDGDDEFESSVMDRYTFRAPVQPGMGEQPDLQPRQDAPQQDRPRQEHQRQDNQRQDHQRQDNQRNEQPRGDYQPRGEYQPRPDRGSDNRNYGDRSQNDRNGGDRTQGERPQNENRGRDFRRERFERQNGNQPRFERPQQGEQSEERPVLPPFITAPVRIPIETSEQPVMNTVVEAADRPDPSAGVAPAAVADETAERAPVKPRRRRPRRGAGEDAGSEGGSTTLDAPTE